MIKFAIFVYILVLSFGAFCALLTFIFDVIKWHIKEKKEDIKSSYETYYQIGGESIGRTGNSGTGTGTGTRDDDNNICTSGNNNDNIERSDSDIQFSFE